MSLTRSTKEVQEAITRAWDCVLIGSDVAYLSGPLTTGPRYVEQVRSGGLIDMFAKQVIQENSLELVSAAQRLRKRRSGIVVEPASLHVPDWSQLDYHTLWEKLIERHVGVVIFMPGWEYSIGCAIEFTRAWAHDIRTEALSGEPISIEDGIALLIAARDDIRNDDADGVLTDLAVRLDEITRRLTHVLHPTKIVSQGLRKDASLDLLAERGMNVAQFVSFSPEWGKPHQAYVRLAGRGANETFEDLRSALEALLNASADKSINVRSYEPHNPQSREFIYGLRNIEDAAAAVERLSAEGLHTIVNETIDVADGGVSGVLMGAVLEFAPDDTPRCVEKPGTTSLPRGWGRELLATVYGFPVELPVPFASRLEFSLHPRPRGWKATNIITWEFSEQSRIEMQAQIEWPNKFSRLLGDKTFGLLVAHHLGLPVPLTTVVNRRIAPFSFGRATGLSESWIRTAPTEQTPGLFTTHRGWIDPFTLLGKEDPDGTRIASLLSQAGVRPAYSGALIVGGNGEIIIEGRSGMGDALMVGEASPETLPASVLRDVRDMYGYAHAALGPVRFEWVHDGEQTWIVQLHRGATDTTASRLTPGDANTWIDFEVSKGLSALRQLLSELPRDTGLILKGRVGLTSHVADVIRKARVPSKIAH